MFVRILTKRLIVLVKISKFLHKVLFLDGGADVSGTAFGGIGGGGGAGAGAPDNGALLLITAG